MNNRIQQLPSLIAELPNLKKLDLRWNKLRAIPAWVSQLRDQGCTVYA